MAEKIEDKAGQDLKGGLDSGLAEAEISLEQDKNRTNEKSKFIDIERPSDRKKKQKDDQSIRNNFSIPGEDETGRNLAMTSFQKIEKVIIDSYGTLSDQTDKRLFYDYLIVNLSLWIDRFETELKINIEEPIIPKVQGNNLEI